MTDETDIENWLERERRLQAGARMTSTLAFTALLLIGIVYWLVQS